MNTNEGDWRGHVAKQLSFIRDRYQYVFVVGLSAGALLALDASTIVDVNGVGILSPTFVYDGWNTPWSHAILPLAMKVLPLSLQQFVFHIDGPPFGIKDDVLQARVRAAYRPRTILREAMNDWWARRMRSKENGDHVPSAASKGYPIFPLRTLTEIDRLITRVRSRLRHVITPTLILQAREDDMTSPRNACIVHDEIASSEKRLVLLDDCYHVITVDKQKRAVVSHVIDFFDSRVSSRQFVPPHSLRHQSATI
jgi:carboxylesterase